MSRLRHECRIADLGRFEDLARDRTIFIAHKERTTTGFAGVLHYAADTDRTIQFRTLFIAQVGVLERLEDALLLRYQHTGKDLFVTNRIFLETVRHHIINVFDENDIGILLVEVLDERTMTTRTEEQLTVFRTERRAIGISSDGIGGR